MSKISELSDGGSLVSTDFLIAVRSGGNVKVQMDTINVDQVDLGDNEFIRLGNSQDLTLVHTSTQSIINQAGVGDLLIQKGGATKLTVNSSGISVTGSVTATTLSSTGLITSGSGSTTSSGLQMGYGNATGWAGLWHTASAINLSTTYVVANNGVSGNTIVNSVGSSSTASLAVNGATKLAASATGIDVTGTATMDGLTVEGNGTYLASLNNTAQDARIQLSREGTEFGQVSAGANLMNLVASGSSTDMRFLTNSAERIRITGATGNVGVGLTTGISSKLHVNTEMSIGADADNRAIVGYTPSRFYIGTRQGGTNYFDTVNVSGGNVGIGVSPNYPIHVEKSVSGDWLGKFKNTHATNGYGLLIHAGDDASVTALSVANYAGAGDYLVVKGDGNVGIGTDSPAIGGGRVYDVALTIDGGVSGGSEDTGALEIGGSTSVNDRLVGSISYFNRDNSGAGATTRKQVAIIEARSVTSDSNTGDDSGANLTFSTKSEGGSVAERLRIDSSGNVQQATSVNSDLYHHIYNANTGTSAEATLYVTNGAISSGLFAGTTGTAFTTTGGFVQDGAHIGSGSASAGGLSIMTRASAPIRFYTNGHTNERMRISADGEVTKPSQPAFSVTVNAAQNNIAINTDVVVIWGAETFDVGSNFSASEFTAPVAGKYQLNLLLRLEYVDSAADYYIVSFYTSNRNYRFIYDLGGMSSGPVYWATSVAVLADMDANDTAYITVNQAGGSAQTDIIGHSSYNRFSGYLVA